MSETDYHETDIHGPQRVNLTDVGDALTFPAVHRDGQNVSRSKSQHVRELDELAHQLVQTFMVPGG